MDWKTFVSNVTTAYAWPVAAVAMVILLRERVGTLLSNLQRFKYKDIEAEFQRDAAEVVAALPPAPAPAPAETKDPPSPDRSAEKAQIARITDLGPRNLVLMSWADVENAVARAAERLGMKTSAPARSIDMRLSYLSVVSDIDPETMAAISRLRDLRNQLAHSGSPFDGIALDAALTFREAATRAIAALDNLKRRDRPYGT